MDVSKTSQRRSVATGEACVLKLKTVELRRNIKQVLKKVEILFLFSVTQTTIYLLQKNMIRIFFRSFDDVKKTEES